LPACVVQAVLGVGCECKRIRELLWSKGKPVQGVCGTVLARRVPATVNCGTGSGGAPVTGVPLPRVR
jgi:hypothetical protein